MIVQKSETKGSEAEGTDGERGDLRQLFRCVSLGRMGLEFVVLLGLRGGHGGC